jgi:histidine ammonia-lyase
MKSIRLDGKSLTRDQLVMVASGAPVELDPAALRDVARAADFLAEQVRREEPIYGVSTGFGALATRHIPAERRAALQRSLIRSHAAGSGDEVLFGGVGDVMAERFGEDDGASITFHADDGRSFSFGHELDDLHVVRVKLNLRFPPG